MPDLLWACNMQANGQPIGDGVSDEPAAGEIDTPFWQLQTTRMVWLRELVGIAGHNTSIPFIIVLDNACVWGCRVAVGSTVPMPCP